LAANVGLLPVDHVDTSELFSRLVVVTVETAPDPIAVPLLVKATEAVGATEPPVSTKAVNVTLPPKTMGLALDESSVTVGAMPTVWVTLPLDAAKFPCAA
jgi:hypothetical protein